MEEKAKLKANVGELWKKKKEDMEANKGKQQAEKMAKEDEKKTHMAFKELKKGFDALWTVKQCSQLERLSTISSRATYLFNLKSVEDGIVA